MMQPFRRTLRRSFLVLTSFSSLLAIALALAVIAAFTFLFVERGQTLRIAVGPPGSAELRFIEALQPRLRQRLWQTRLGPSGAGSARNLARGHRSALSKRSAEVRPTTRPPVWRQRLRGADDRPRVERSRPRSLRN